MDNRINAPPMPSSASAVMHSAARPIASVTEQLVALFALVLAKGSALTPAWLEPDRFDARDGAVHRASQATTVITVVVIGIVSLIGILIYSQVNSSISLPAGSNLNGSLTTITDGFGGAMELVPVILIVLLASVVIVVVQRMRGGGGGGF